MAWHLEAVEAKGSKFRTRSSRESLLPAVEADVRDSLSAREVGEPLKTRRLAQSAFEVYCGNCLLLSLLSLGTNLRSRVLY